MVLVAFEAQVEMKYNTANFKRIFTIETIVHMKLQTNLKIPVHQLYRFKWMNHTHISAKKNEKFRF